MGVSAQVLQRLGRRGLRVGFLRVPVVAVACAVLLCGVVLLAPSAALALEAQRWTLQDRAGRPWSLTLLEQTDPAHPSGLRLRLTDRSGSQRLDHCRSLQLRDGLGGVWELENRSGELVPAGEASLPDGSAQFDLPHLEPQPRSELPLLLLVPLASDDFAELMASPPAVAALHDASGR